MPILTLWLLFPIALCASVPANSASFSTVHNLHPMAVKIYGAVIDSKTLFQKPSNDSANSQMRLKSFDPFVKVDGVTFYFLPESIVWAAYDHPEAVDLSKYNQSCLKLWAKQYNKTLDSCPDEISVDAHTLRFFCKSPNANACEKKERREGECRGSAIDLGNRMNEVVFPDGRSVGDMTWNCSSWMECCEYGCCTPTPVLTYYPRPTTPSPVASAREILYILLKVCIISSLVCALLSFCIRYYAYLHRRAQVQTGTMAPTCPIPAKTDYTSFPPPSVPYAPSCQYPPQPPPRVPIYPFSPPFEAPPPYVAPPPYSERPVDPLPKVV